MNVSFLFKNITHIKKSVLVVNYLHLPLYSFKRIGQGLSHSCCQAAINKALEWSEAKRGLLPELVQVHVDHTETHREGEST